MKILLFDFNGVLEDVAKELHNRGHELLNHDGKVSTFKKADVIVLWNQTELGGWCDWIKDARKIGKRVVLVQHGRRGTSRIFPPFNEPLICDVICSWGENDRKRMESCGIDPEKIKVTGTPVLHHVLPRLSHEGINIIFSPDHWDKEIPENIIVKTQLMKLVDEYNNSWFKKKKMRIISKILRGTHNPNDYPNPVISDRSSPGHLDIVAKTLQNADIVVSIAEGTMELMAQMMGIPVVVYNNWIPKACDGDDRYKEYFREFSNACAQVKDINKLNETILKHLKHPELLKKEREEIVILDGGIDIKDPISEIIKVIESK